MKAFLINFILFVYLDHIQEDWDDYNKLGKIVIYPAWVVRSFLMWLICPLFIPEYFFKKSKLYAATQEFGKLSPDQMKEFNKINTQNFLNKRRKS